MGKLVEIKTKENDASVANFIQSVTDEQKRKDSFTLLKLMQKVTKEKPKMWGSSMIGFGNKRYKSAASGREVDWFLIGFSPRKSNLSLHFMDIQTHAEALKKLGKYKSGSGCLLINKLEDVDLTILEGMIRDTVKKM